MTPLSRFADHAVEDAPHIRSVDMISVEKQMRLVKQIHIERRLNCVYINLHHLKLVTFPYS